MKLTQQVNQKVSYILLAVVGALMLTMVVLYMYGGSPAVDNSAPATAENKEAGDQENHGESVRGAMPDAAAVEQKLDDQQTQADQGAADHAPASDASLGTGTAQMVTPEPNAADEQNQEASSQATLDNAAQQAAQQAADDNTPEAEGAASAEAAASVEQGAEAAAAATDSVEQAAKEAAKTIAEGPAKKAEKPKAKQASKSRKEKGADQKNRLTAINVVPTQYGVVIRLQTDVPVEHTRWDRIRSPSRVYLDMFGAFKTGISDQNLPDNPFVKKLRIGVHKDKIRIVADLASEKLPKNVKVTKGSDRVVVLEMSDFR